MQRLELIEIDPLDGGTGYGGGYGGSGALVLSEYIPPKAKAQTGELWMSFLNDPAKKPFKVQDVAAGQRVQIPSLPDAPIRLYLISNDPSGRKTVVNLNAARVRDLNVNKELRSPIIEKIGQSTLESVSIGIKNYTETVKFRKIEIADNDEFTSGYNVFIKDFDGIVKIIGAVETIARSFSPTGGATKKIRVSHSTNNISYSAPSNVLTVQFINENNNGIPIIGEVGQGVRLVGTSESKAWQFDLPKPFINGGTATHVELLMTDDTTLCVTNNAWSATDTAIAIDLSYRDLSGFAPSGYAFTIVNGVPEIFRYGYRDGGALYDLKRGCFNTSPIYIPYGANIWYIPFHKDLAETTVFLHPQLEHSMHCYFRWQNTYRDNGSDGWSALGYVGRAQGTIENVVPTVPAPPLYNPPQEQPGYESPYEPENNKDNIEYQKPWLFSREVY